MQTVTLPYLKTTFNVFIPTNMLFLFVKLAFVVSVHVLQ